MKLLISSASSTLLLPSSSPVWELHMKQRKMEINPKAKSYCLFDGYAHLSSGLAYGLAGVSTGMAIRIVGDANVSWKRRKVQKDWARDGFWGRKRKKRAS
ncbi:hypothetical protein Patl1_17328 [Pistacia atlantica]|uniref:Uncharacterized protein n=1 Tax=Pistacia atlantica TaxID=434234 RepID=A0ACC1B6Y7_9ROSI|nr:hypothetical protein Patl1_17328 [Pistacia atlantica]